MTISIKEPKNCHSQTRSLLTLLNTIIPNSIIVKSHSKECDLTIDIIQDTTPAYLVIHKRNEYKYGLKICEYRNIPTKFIPSSDTQLVLNNFSSTIGSSLAYCLMEIFSCNLESRQIVSFSVKDEFLYFRMYQYCFGASGPIFNKAGPHITFRVVKYIKYDDKVSEEFYDYSKVKCML